MVEEKEQLVGYGSALFTMPSGVARPRRPPRTPHTARTPALRSKEEKAAGDHRPQTWCQGFDALASVQKDTVLCD